jgi:hypothetical protein
MSQVGLKVFSATTPRDRGGLGDVITKWLAELTNPRILGWRVLQTSDSAYHCLTIVFFFEEPA